MNNKNIFYAFLTIFALLSVYFVFAAAGPTLYSPANNTWNLSSTIEFQFKCNGSHVGYNATVFLDGASNQTGGLQSNYTGFFVNDTISNITVPRVPDAANIIWNIECCNGTRDECTQATVNFTLKVDTTDPAGYITMPKVTRIYALFPIKLKCSGSDATSGVDYVELKVTKPSGKILDYRLDSQEEKTLSSKYTGEAGTYVIDCKVYDIAGNSYDTDQGRFYAYYRSVTAGEPEVGPEEEITPEDEEDKAAPAEGVPIEEKAPGKAWIWILVIVVIILILYFVLKKKK